MAGHVAALCRAAKLVAYWTNSDQIWDLVSVGNDANDPTATLAVHCGNGFDAGFSPYQSTRLNR